ncbi:MAG: winged helix-turn-helix transcriptional regulator [Candidatus Omnitrophica bacterium]|nr:winged helix-turn-helix transcriptional regulator [Candidatus Omnitrophota bacterium]MBI3009492.1 winged helix-turn-helix transcriptional regulator [Candidatus Omnitrophota bacterium]
MAIAQTNQAHLIKTAFLKVLAHPLRLRILELLGQREQSVGQFAQTLSVDQPTVSRHLGILKQGGLVMTRQDGASVIYRLQNEETVQLLQQLTELLKYKLRVDQELLKSVEES